MYTVARVASNFMYFFGGQSVSCLSMNNIKQPKLIVVSQSCGKFLVETGEDFLAENSIWILFEAFNNYNFAQNMKRNQKLKGKTLTQLTDVPFQRFY